MTSSATVYLVDDNPEVLAATAAMVAALGLPTETFASAEEFLRGYAGGPGCLVSDIKMPGLSGLDLQATLHARGVLIPIVFLSGYADVPTAVKAIRSGAVEVLEKHREPAEVLAVISQAIEKDKAMRAAQAEKAAIRARLATLSPREKEVAAGVVAGRLSKQIGADLGISVSTVEVHRSRIMRKLGAQSVADLVRMILIAGMPDDLAGGG